MVWAGPPDASTFLSFPPAKNPMKRLSGDQKMLAGPNTPSVPTSAVDESESSGRTHTRSLPPELAMKAIRRPSGESTIVCNTPLRAVFSGGMIESLRTRLSGGVLRKERVANAIRARTAIPATIQAINSRDLISLGAQLGTVTVWSESDVLPERVSRAKARSRAE